MILRLFNNANSATDYHKMKQGDDHEWWVDKKFLNEVVTAYLKVL
jgi:hypothetical protein